jgi:predicted HTH transcriptional regulator
LTEPNTNPDLEVAAALNELVRKLKGRAANAERYVTHKRTLDKVIPKLSKIADEITGEGVTEGVTERATRNERVADATDAIVAALDEPRTRAELKEITGIHHKTIEGAMRGMVRDGAAEYDPETQRYALTA